MGAAARRQTTGICPAISGATKYFPCSECSRLVDLSILNLAQSSKEERDRGGVAGAMELDFDPCRANAGDRSNGGAETSGSGAHGGTATPNERDQMAVAQASPEEKEQGPGGQ
jgi:hypothetical protein